MTSRFFLCLGIVALDWVQYAPLALAQAVPPNTATCLSAAEAELAALTNAYRQQNSLAALPVSFSLSSVAQWHVWDLHANSPDGGSCNLHSWSNARPTLWQPMCYTADHAQAAQMWNKPRQVTANAYNSNGYEIAAGAGGTISASLAMNLWKGSAAHSAVILNSGIWAPFPWHAMGVGLHQGYAVIWFGELADPLGAMTPCSTANPDLVFASGFES